MEYICVAIDGPSGAGKSTLARALAAKYKFIYVDTGAIYRTVGLFAKKNSIDPKDEKTLSEKFGNIKIGIIKSVFQRIINLESVSDHTILKGIL